MIIGNDILHELGIDLLFSEERIRWGNPRNPFGYDSIPMKTLGTLSDNTTCSMIYDLHTTSPILQEEEDRHRKILDADYYKVDIDQIRLVKQQLRKSKPWISLVIINCRYFAKNSIQIVRVVSYFYLN